MNSRVLSALSSVLLLVIAFPGFNQPWAAWVAFMPWFLLLRSCSRRAAWWWSYGIGALFFLASLWWLIYVSVLGWLLLGAYLAGFFGLFGWLIARAGRELWWDRLRWLAVPAGWVALEWLRSQLFSGFGWNLLAYAQAPFHPLIQCAELTGAWGVSFLVVLVNTGLVRLLLPGMLRSRAIGGTVGAVLAVVVACGWGDRRMARLGAVATARIAVVQGNIPQEDKWDPDHQQAILGTYLELTRQAAATQPDLIIWPETSVPGYFGIEEEVTQPLLQLARQLERPLLIGAPTAAISPDGARYFNSAVLIEPDGRIGRRYDKLHLVPFGEYVPGEGFLPWLRRILPPIGDFSPGRAYTVFNIPMRDAEFGMRHSNSALRTPHSALQFSTLICFEDVFPEMARRFVAQGARLLLVITNDAWFGPTAAAYQHAQASTLRAVELRVPIARAANTGWSGCIDTAGRWTGSVRAPDGRELFVAGTHTCELPVGTGATPYQRWGDWFVLLCALFAAAIFFLRRTL